MGGQGWVHARWWQEEWGDASVGLRVQGDSPSASASLDSGTTANASRVWKRRAQVRVPISSLGEPLQRSLSWKVAGYFPKALE